MRHFVSAYVSLISRPFRTLLTMFGIIIGVAAIYAMISIGNGAKKTIISTLDGINTRSISITPRWTENKASRRTERRPFSEADIAEISRIEGVESVSGENAKEFSVTVPGADLEIGIKGSYAFYLRTKSMTLNLGRNLNETDMQSKALVVIIGSSVAQSLFGSNHPIGETVKIDKIPFTIVGVVEKYEAKLSSSTDANKLILIPRTTARSRLMGGHASVKNHVGSITVIFKQEQDFSRIEDNIEHLLRFSRGLSASDKPDFRIFNFAAARNQMMQIQRVMSLLLGSIGTIILIVGGVGVMNIMLVNVTERTHEIGLRLSVGARRSDILWQFVIEAILLCGLAGIVGLGLGWGTIALAEIIGEFKMDTSWSVAALAFGSSLFVGLIFGYLPARRASRLHPVEALRHE